MTKLANSFEGTTVGSTIDPSTSAVGGAGITVYNNGGGVAQYVSSPVMHGTRAAHLSGVNGTGNITAFLPAVNTTTYAFRVYCRIPSATTGEVRPLQLIDINTNQALLVRRTGSIFAVRASSSTDVWTSSAPGTVFPLDSWVRMELVTNVTNGSMAFYTYAGDSATPLWSNYMASGWGFAAGGSSILRTNFGFVGNSIGDIYFDDPAEDDNTSTTIGPGGTPPTVSLALTDSLARITATGGGAAPLSYAITQTAGTATTPIADGTGQWLIPKHATDTLTYRVTVTDAYGQTANTTKSVPPIPSGTTGAWPKVPAAAVPTSNWG